MTVTPDPGLFKRQVEKKQRMEADLTSAQKKFNGTDSVLHRAMSRAIDYQQNEDLGMHMNSHASALRLIGNNAGPAYRSRGVMYPNNFMQSNIKTPMPARMQNLMVE